MLWIRTVDGVRIRLADIAAYRPDYKYVGSRIWLRGARAPVRAQIDPAEIDRLLEEAISVRTEERRRA